MIIMYHELDIEASRLLEIKEKLILNDRKV